MSRLVKLAVLSCSVVIFCYVGLGYVLGQSSDRAYRSLTVFSEVLHHIQQDYVEEPNLPVVTAGALRGLLESLDPQSSYLSPREFAEYKKQTENPPKGETGAALSKRFGYIAVISVLPESPAFRAGLRSGDILENIAGFTTREMSIGQATVLVAGAPSSGVKVSAVRRGRSEPQEIEIIRGEPGDLRLVAEKLTPEGDASAEAAVGYLRVPALNAGKAEDIQQKLAQFERQGVKKLVLDLRECAMGEPAEGIAVARLFLTSGTVGALRGQTVARQEFAAEPAKAVWKQPITVLISNGTSGAAEILAAAIADNKRGQTVGERTFGTASQQKLITLEDGAAIVLTVANYYTPAGKSIPDEGVVPTVTVNGGDDFGESAESFPLPRDKDEVLKKALELMKGAAPAHKTAQKLPPSPRRLAAAA